MSHFVLFPQLVNAVEWLKGHSSIVIQYSWNIVAAIILFFIGKMISRLISGGLHIGYSMSKSVVGHRYALSYTQGSGYSP